MVKRSFYSYLNFSLSHLNRILCGFAQYDVSLLGF